MSSSSGLISASSGIRAVASRFERADPELVFERALLQRRDTKFLVPSSLAVWVLARVLDSYLVVERHEHALLPYRTDYYDTEHLQCFFDHVHGRRPRVKVRVRQYLDGKCFFEVKAKDEEGTTRKYRRRRQCIEDAMSAEEALLVSQHTTIDPASLRPSVGVDYERLTLVHRERNERVTVDVNLALRLSQRRIDFPDVAIFEVKQPCSPNEEAPSSTVQTSPARCTEIVEALASHDIHASSASKYCSALALADDSLAVGCAAEMLGRLDEATAPVLEAEPSLGGLS